MTDFHDELLSELFFAARETEGFFTLYLTDGEKLSARPVCLRRSRKKYGAPRLILLLPDGRTRGLSADRLDGFTPPMVLREQE